MLEDLTNGDRLTGAVTRRAWETTLERELVRAARTGEAVTVGFLDFDGFQKFNDRFGADAGDDVLRRSVAAWRRELRAGDLLGRIDGDGFGVALPGCTAEGAHEVVERLRVATTDLQTCSIGLAQWKKGESTKHFIDRALAALKAAKQQGRDRTVIAVEPVSAEPAAADSTVDDDVLESPTFLEQAAANSRSLIAELHAVAEASATPKEEAQDDTTVEETPSAASPVGARETSDTTEPGAREADVEPGETEPVDTPGLDEESSDEDELALVSKADGALVTLEHDLDGLLSVRGAKEIHQLLRDLSSTR
jgi:diguanylate cyclase (GGDEF)-like protein